MYSGSINLDPQVDANALPGILASSLRAVRAKDVVELADRVTFTGGVFRFVSNWNVLVPFTTGELVIDTTARRLAYRVSFAQLVRFLILFTIVATVFMLVGQFPLPMIPVFLAVMWLWLGGGNVLIGIVRFENFLRRTINDAATPASASVPKEQAPPTKRPRRYRLFVLAGFGVALVVAVVIWCIYLTFFAGINPGPSFVDELRAGTIAEADIKAIEILKSDGWSFSESEYARKARRRIGPAETKELVGILLSASTNGHKNRNHPVTLYYGIIRIEMVQGGHFYVLYRLGYYNNQYYVYVNANSKNSTNPNGTEQYENVPLADFLKRNDPWYRDIDSPTNGYRPNFPDNVP